MIIDIVAKAEINGKQFAKGIRVDLEKASEELIRMSLIGELGKPFGDLLIAAKRTKEYEKVSE